MTTHDLWIFECLGSAFAALHITVQHRGFSMVKFSIVLDFYFLRASIQEFSINSISFRTLANGLFGTVTKIARRFLPFAKLLNARIVFPLN